jgi:hypothetical protein
LVAQPARPHPSVDGDRMSSVLPVGTPLGSLSLDEVFVSYDGPQLFSARNAAGQRYLAVAVDEEGDVAVFLWVPVSAGRYMALRSGLTPLREVFLEPEESVFVVQSRYIDGTHKVRGIGPSEIPDDWLPDAGALMSLGTPTQVPFRPSELQVRADEETRTIVALELDRPDLMRTEYPLRDLQELLADVQEAVHAMAAEAEGKATSTGSVPEYIVRDSELSLIDLQAASFVVILAPTLGDRMVEMPLATLATDHLLSIIDAVDDSDQFRSAIAGLEQRAISKLRGLMEDLFDTNASLNAYLARPSGQLRLSAMTPQGAGRGLEILAEASTTVAEVFVERAVLIGANVRTRAFELRDDSTDEKYSGKIDPDALGQVDGLQLGEAFRYIARILVEQSYSAAYAEPKTKHRLRMIRRLVEGKPDWNPAAGEPEAK